MVYYSHIGIYMCKSKSVYVYDIKVEVNGIYGMSIVSTSLITAAEFLVVLEQHS